MMVHERFTERIDEKLKLKKEFPSLGDTIETLALRLELFEDTGLSPKQVLEMKEKQTPKKVTEIYEISTNYVTGHYGVCPKCEADSISYGDAYCWDCGQKLDWI